MVIETLKDLKGFWQYDGGKYLVEDNGKISDTFIDTSVLTTRPELLKEFVRELDVVSIVESNDYKCIDYICSPTPNSMTLGYELARQFGCQAIFTEPRYEIKDIYPIPEIPRDYQEVNIGKLGIVKSGQELKFDMPDDAIILLAEDVITTGKSIGEMIEAVRYKNEHIKILPYILCLINRSCKQIFIMQGEDKDSNSVSKIISLADVQARTWDTLAEAKKDCPNVIEAVRPKQSWGKLIGG